MRNFLRRLFNGRYGSYGSDKLTSFLLILAVALLLISIIFEPLAFLYYLAFVSLAYCYFRMFSKNIPQRLKEKETFDHFLSSITGFFKFKKEMLYDKEYHIYKCPNCGQRIRIPRGAGKVVITCPICKREFKKRS